jgi:RimJ/RimL family protein N-acetyltransferase
VSERVVVLSTQRLDLRRFTRDDLDRLVALDSDPEVTFFITGGVPEFEPDFLDGYLAYYERYPGYGFWAVEERTTGRFIGWFHLRPEPDLPEDEPELGYRLVRSAWGKGYATEGSRALVDRAFRELGARRVHATTMTVNAGSRRVMEKAGLRFVRTFFMAWPWPIPGDEQGDVEYAITREQWLADQGVDPES